MKMLLVSTSIEIKMHKLIAIEIGLKGVGKNLFQIHFIGPVNDRTENRNQSRVDQSQQTGASDQSQQSRPIRA